MGGAEKVVLDLATYTNKNDFNTYVVSMSKHDELLSQYLDNNIDTTVLKKSNSFKDFISIIKEINIFVQEKKIAIIHAHMTHSIIVASIIKILNPSLKIVFTSHSSNIGSKLREMSVWLLKPFRDVDILFSKELLNYFYKSKYEVIPNGIKIDTYDLDVKKNEKFTFIAIGRLEIVKNHLLLLEIVNELKDKYDFQLQIVGDGNLRNEIEDKIKKYNLEDKVKLLGLRIDIPNLLNQSHCLVMPSLWEGLPIVILEAGASSLPVISTPVGSIPSIINEQNGYLSNTDDFKQNMINVLDNYNLAKNKGKLFFKDISRTYSIDSITSKHEKLYKSLLSI
ncbi:MAG: glycosyltransferase family 4 protein [Sulfurimonas sp.]|nr:glycosyltransferase family 4 protein [Sulfurimonas sp.]